MTEVPRDATSLGSAAALDNPTATPIREIMTTRKGEMGRPLLIGAFPPLSIAVSEADGLILIKGAAELLATP